MKLSAGSDRIQRGAMRRRLCRKQAVWMGEHTRPRVFRPAPSPVGEGPIQSQNYRDLFGCAEVVGEGAGRGPRGRARSPLQPNLCG